MAHIPPKPNSTLSGSYLTRVDLERLRMRLPPIHTYTTYAIGSSDLEVVMPQPLEKVNSTQELIGFRFWRVEKGRLHSLVKEEQWPIKSPLERVCKEECRQRGLSTLYPEFIRGDCHWPEDSYCGIYAYKTVDNLFADISESVWWGRNQPKKKIFGTVKLWGTVLECEKGYKAQYAEPENLYAVDEFDPIEIMEVEENHGLVQSIEPNFANKLKNAMHNAEVDLETERYKREMTYNLSVKMELLLRKP